LEHQRNDVPLSTGIKTSDIPELLHASRELGISELEAFCIARENRDAPSVREVSLEELLRHSSREDCWIVIDGGVYDVTSWLPKHPGGTISLKSVRYKFYSR